MLVFHGNLIHCTDESGIEILKDKIIGVDGPKIIFVEDWAEWHNLGIHRHDIRALAPSEFLLPGFVDAHVHPQQYIGAGTHLDQQLVEWLDNYVKPMRERLESDMELAENVHRRVVRRMLKNGTTTAAYFPTNSVQTTVNLCDVVESMGQRAVVGVVHWGSGLDDSITRDAADKTETIINNIKERKTDLLSPSVNPASTFTTSTGQLKKLAEISTQHGVPVHSHIAESLNAMDRARDRNPGCTSDVDILNRYGLLHEQSIMAHGVHLTNEDIQLIAKKQVGIVHCPNSNISLKSGLCDVRRLEASGVKVALGTDVSGGYSASMLDAMRHTVQTSNVLKLMKYHAEDDYSPLNFKDALRLATLGGSRVLGLQDKIGNFTVGKQFDALRINLEARCSPVDIFPTDHIEEMLQKFFYLGDDRNIVEVYVAGENVTPQ